MKKIVLEEIQRIHEIMGISGKKLLIEGLPNYLAELLTKSIIGTQKAFDSAYNLIKLNTSYSDMKYEMEALYKNLADAGEEGRIIIDSLSELSRIQGKSTEELLYLALKNEQELKNLTDKIAELQIKISLGIGNYKIVGSLDDLIEGSSGVYRKSLLNAVETLDNMKTRMLDLTNDELEKLVENVKSSVEGETSISKKVKDFYITSLTRIADDVKKIKSGTETTNYTGLKPLEEFKNELSKVRTIDDYIQKVKDNFPMTEDEAYSFLKNYNGDYFRDFSEFRVGGPKGDYIKVATFIKNKNFISAPIGEYLYHGTDSQTVDSVISSGWLDNSMGVEINPGALGQVTKKTTAAGDINTSKIYASSTARQKGTQEVLLRFNNVNNEPITFFAHYDRVPASQIEKSLDGGETWTKLIDNN
jgi:hypothetical protein